MLKWWLMVHLEAVLLEEVLLEEVLLEAVLLALGWKWLTPCMPYSHYQYACPEQGIAHTSCHPAGLVVWRVDKGVSGKGRSSH